LTPLKATFFHVSKIKIDNFQKNIFFYNSLTSVARVNISLKKTKLAKRIELNSNVLSQHHRMNSNVLSFTEIVGLTRRWWSM